MIRYLLDTNIVIYVVKKHPLGILQTFNKNSGGMARHRCQGGAISIMAFSSLTQRDGHQV